MNFPTSISDIEERIKAISPKKYSSTRNFKNGAVSYLSPYISRGVISTKQVFTHLKEQNYKWEEIEKFVQELAWRDYWQQIWIAKGELINQDLKNTQTPVRSNQMPSAILNAKTGITAVDEAITELQKTGYMHNHMRMYVAAITCNIAQCHWLVPAKWMYSLLLDGDWASNALSWQWVAGANANKKYFANQENINKYFESNQTNTFLDCTYEDFKQFEELNPDSIPSSLLKTETQIHNYQVPKSSKLKINPDNPTLIYNYYNIDPYWHVETQIETKEETQKGNKDKVEYNRVFIFDTNFYEQYPVNQNCIDFTLQLLKNIPNIQIFTGTIEELNTILNTDNIIYKEHPTNKNYIGTEEPRDWLCSATGYFPSFFNFWKKCKKEIKF